MIYTSIDDEGEHDAMWKSVIMNVMVWSKK